MPAFPPTEYQDRLARCQTALAAAGLDAALILPGTNLLYFTGLKFARERYRLLVALIPDAGELHLFGTGFEEAKLAGGKVPARVHLWSDEEDQYRRVGDQIRKSWGETARIGLEPTCDLRHLFAWQEALPGATFRQAVTATDGLRAVKSEAEVACLREAAARTRTRMLQVPTLLRTGMTEKELAREFGPGAMIQFGRTTSRPNEVAGDRELQPGDAIVIDAGDRVAGYRSDLTRTFCHGEPSPDLREVYRIVDEAERAAIAAAQPGAPAEEVDLAARRVITAAGYGEFFTHRGGHGIGLDFHELPLAVAGNRQPLEPGMVLTAEPGIYLPGRFGVRLEDDLLITPTGPEVLCERGPLWTS